MTYDTDKPWNKLLKLKNLPFGSISCVQNRELENEVISIINKVSSDACLFDPSVQDKFLSRYPNWIEETTLNRFSGFSDFKTAAFSNGTTESFDKFYLKHKNKRMRCFRGEYMYHLVVADQYFEKFAYIDDEPLEHGDVVIFSLPFADNGGEHWNMSEVLNQCDKLNIPVLIDCCYFGVCKDIHFDFSHKCIEVITFSLSKIFPVQHLKIGMRLTRSDDDDPLMVYNRNKYINRLGAAVGLELMNRYSPDFNQNLYGNNQTQFCETLSVLPSKCVFFGLGGEEYAKYNRGTHINRLCFSKYLKSGILP